MKVLIIGLGSIAKKHLEALVELAPQAEVFALRSGISSESLVGINDIFSWEEVPGNLDFIIVSNPTSEHYFAIKKSLDFEIPLFIEKPPFMSLLRVEELITLAELKGVRTYTAFNFRFHPIILWLRKNLLDKRILEVQAYCGSFLPDWRPGRNYQEVYSAKNELGGGVHLDLIHELDYLLWIFGEPQQVHGFRSHVSDLAINSIDVAHYWLEYGHLNISILLNYYRREPKRTLEIVMADATWIADLVNSEVVTPNGGIIFSLHQPTVNTYKEQMKYFLDGLGSGEPYMNNLRESVKTLTYCLK